MSARFESAIYEGRIRHRRFEPVEREFSYRIFMAYLDLEEVPEVMRVHPLWSTRRRSPASFRRSDYLGPPELPLRDAVLERVAAETGRRPAGPVRMLTHLRFWGVCFNPVTFYYCFDRNRQRVETVLAEVTNVPWGERHVYLIDRPAENGVLRAEVAKRMHVSPLMGMDHRYELVFGRPGPTIAVHMESRKDELKHFDATLRLERREISHRLLSSLLFKRVPVPAKVLGGIHLQAARSWLAGARFHPHPGTAAGRDLPNPAENGILHACGDESFSR